MAACGGATEPRLSTSFTVASLSGHGPSPFDVFEGRTIAFDVTLDAPWATRSTSTVNGQECRSTRVTSDVARRTATGDGAADVQALILDPLPEWSATIMTCADSTSHRTTLGVLAVVDAINTRYDCATVPQSVIAHDADGYPELVSFTARDCVAEIYDVSNNRILNASGFTLDVDVGSDHVP